MIELSEADVPTSETWCVNGRCSEVEMIEFVAEQHASRTKVTVARIGVVFGFMWCDAIEQRIFLNMDF